MTALLFRLCVFAHFLGGSQSLSFRPPFSVSHKTPLAVTSELQKLPSRNNIKNVETNDNQYQLTAVGLMLCGSISRTVAALAIHPLHATKVNLQLQQPRSNLQLPPILLDWKTLTRGLGPQLLLTLPHGALSFAVTDLTKRWLINATNSQQSPNRTVIDPLLDLLAAGFSSLICSIISIPQMLLTDRIMVGYYPSLSYGLRDIIRAQGKV